MRPKTNDQDPAVEVPVELAHRAADGIGILLLWDQGEGRLRVVIDDLRTSESFELSASNGRQALDLFYHPFAYAAARGIAYRTARRPDGESDLVRTATPASSAR